MTAGNSRVVSVHERGATLEAYDPNCRKAVSRKLPSGSGGKSSMAPSQ
jgi:hypothetical protein